MTPSENWLIENQTQVFDLIQAVERHVHRPGPMKPLVMALNALPLAKQEVAA